MPISTDILETFFGARFEFMDRTLSEFQSLRHFDGFTHWEAILDEGSGLLRVAADRERFTTPFPTLEIEGFYTDVTLTPVQGVGTALVFRPAGALDSSNYLVITKTKEGRLSLSTTLGHRPISAEPSAPPDAGSATASPAPVS